MLCAENNKREKLLERKTQCLEKLMALKKFRSRSAGPL